jgi:hypothetical protein
VGKLLLRLDDRVVDLMVTPHLDDDVLPATVSLFAQENEIRVVGTAGLRSC